MEFACRKIKNILKNLSQASIIRNIIDIAYNPNACVESLYPDPNESSDFC